MYTAWIDRVDAWVVVLALSVAWLCIGLLSGLVAQHLPSGWISEDTWITRERHLERGGRTYERLRIRSWKDRLPESAGVGSDGVSKRHLGGSDGDTLWAFATETRRAEYVHWMNVGAGPAFVVVLPAPVALVVTAAAVVVHLPFVMVQRYNRIRIGRVTARRARRVGRRAGTRPEPGGDR